MTVISLISDVLLVLTTVALAAYCWRLGKRLKAFNDVDSSLGGSIAALSLQVDELKVALDSATTESEAAGDNLSMATDRANDSIGRLEMLIAAAEDVASTPPPEPEMEPETDAFIHFRARRDASGGSR